MADETESEWRGRKLFNAAVDEVMAVRARAEDALLNIAAARNLLDELIAHHDRMAVNWCPGRICDCNIVQCAKTLTATLNAALAPAAGPSAVADKEG